MSLTVGGSGGATLVGFGNGERTMERHRKDSEARLLEALKLYELEKLFTGRAADLAGMERVELLFTLRSFGPSPVGVEPEELEQDVENARR